MTNQQPESDFTPEPTGPQTNSIDSSSGQDFEVEQSRTQIGRYEIIKRLGKGGFGNVFLAKDPELHRKVAIKVPRWDKPLSSKGVSQFLNEGKMLAQVNHHSIVGVHDVGTTDDGIPFVVMEFIEGKDLSYIIKNDSLVKEEVISILLKVATALQQAHKKGLVHRDFKPSNVIVDDSGQIHLVDFGLALHDELSADAWDSSHVAGTPSYMAPEQIRGENHLIDGQTDIWAFGVTMYRMLTTKLPFKQKGRELIREICYKNPKPLRQLDETISRSLERICLRCLQKLMGERYQSMADVIEELEAYVEETKGKSNPSEEVDLSDTPSAQKLEKISSQNTQDSNPVSSPSGSAGSNKSESGTSHSQGTQSGSKTSSRSQSNSSSHDEPISIVPKGLRAFDRNDRDFFLHLIPGPTDRLGTPESIRFWVHRLDVADQVDDISVGVIYGPSGSGKSSFVRAGLIPRLSENVIPVYVDCSAPDLAQQIVKQIHREIHEVPVDESLSKLLRRIRKGQYTRQGDKLLLVLDQFEQWLSQAGDMEQEEVTVALRQCDPERVQALLLIRDEFWLSASQFLRFLGQRIEEKRNAMPLPLFDKRHARRVLEAIGRAYQVLPQEPQPLSKSQSRFVREAVDSLAKRDRVVCVHLSVFAETTKSMEWNYGELKAVGGWEGIGRDYVAGIFNNPETPVFIKRHSQEAWSILRQLLPQTASELKGTAVELESLYENSDSKMSRATFDELIRFLEFDCNLISRSESLDEDGDGSFDPSPKYGLTHDFLVKPIREWGHAKQNETLRGRATSEFENLAKQWDLTKDNRFLPGLWDYARFKFHVPPKFKTSYFHFWIKARGRNIRRALVYVLAAFIFFALSMWANLIIQKKNRSILLNRFLTSDSSFIDEDWPKLSKILHLVSTEIDANTNSEDVRRRFRANCLCIYKNSNARNSFQQIIQDLPHLPNSECKTLVFFSKNSERFSTYLVAAIDDIKTRQNITAQKADLDDIPYPSNIQNGNTESLIFLCRAAITLAYLNDCQPLQSLLRDSVDPTPRYCLITEIPKWNSGLSELLRIADERSEGTSRRDTLSGILSGFGLIDNTLISEPAQEIKKLRETLYDLYIYEKSGSVHSAVWYVLTKWNLKIPAIEESPVNAEWRQIEISLNNMKFDIPFVKVYPSNFQFSDGMQTGINAIYKSEKYRFPKTKPFWISTIELPPRLIFEYSKLTKDEKPRSKQVFETMSKCKKGKLLASTSHEFAIEFLNWLNTQENRTTRYKVSENGMVKVNGNGTFGLPKLVQFETAQRGNSRTAFYFGRNIQLLKTYCGFGVQMYPGAPGRFPPNVNGCFDLVGNYREWVEETYLFKGVSVLRQVKGTSPDRGFETYQSGYFQSFPKDEFDIANTSFRITMDE